MHARRLTSLDSSPRLSGVTGDALANAQENMTLEGLLQCTCRVDRAAHEMPGLIAFTLQSWRVIRNLVKK